MSKIRFTLYDDRRAVYGRVEGNVADSMIGTLSADPETIAEFERAMCRFFHPEFAQRLRSEWTESTGGGRRRQKRRATLSIDLPGRLLLTRWNQAKRPWEADYFADNGRVQNRFQYDLSHEWMLKQSEMDLRDMAMTRREQRRAARVDVRGVLFGQPLMKFLVEHCQCALADKELRFSEDWSQQRASGWYRQDDGVYQIARRIHKEWLLSERKDLGSKTVRDAMMADREHVSVDISHRISQWAMQDECPVGLSESDNAFVHGGMGTHEIVLYYDLVRELLFTYFENAPQLLERSGRQDGGDGMSLLERRRDKWLDTPQPNVLTGYTPREAIERERLRLPLVQSNEHAALHDDCPVCRMSTELGLGPAFIYLDDLHLDEEFAFSLHTCQAEWQQEQDEWKQTEKEFNDHLSECGHSEDPENDEIKSRLDRSEDSIWQRVYINEEMLGSSVSENVMAIGFFIAELVEDIKRQASDDELVKQVNRHYENLAPATLPGHRCVLRPVISRLGETIDDVAQQCPALTAKCLDLQSRLVRMSEMCDP